MIRKIAVFILLLGSFANANMSLAHAFAMDGKRHVGTRESASEPSGHDSACDGDHSKGKTFDCHAVACVEAALVPSWQSGKEIVEIQESVAVPLFLKTPEPRSFEIRPPAAAPPRIPDSRSYAFLVGVVKKLD